MLFTRYDKICGHYARMWPLLIPGYITILKAMLDVVRARPERPKAILDLGCGPASATVAVASACHPQGRVTLVDGSKRMIDAAIGLLGDQVESSIVGDFTRTKIADRVFAPNAYDLVLSSFALHHLDDGEKRQVVESSAHSLQPGGLFLLADEVATERPGGWDVVERVRAQAIHEQLQAGRISGEMWQIETSLTPEERLPFLPARIDDMTSYIARAGLAVSSPVHILGSALFVALKPE